MIETKSIAEQLCLSCGLCCNGVLFKDVELQPADNAAHLVSLGLPITTRARGAAEGKSSKVRISQPCAALCSGNRCQVYHDRPSRCREFECAVFKAVQKNEIELPAALRTIRSARQRAEKVRQLFRELGDRDETLALSLRFKRIRRRLESKPASDSEAELFADLTLAVHDLNYVLSQDFYPGSNSSLLSS
jgi:Fe-S-cluster containining protein